MILRMLKVVSNTTPIITLLKLSRLDILKLLYGKIYISEAVYHEIEAGKESVYYTDLKFIEWIVIEKIRDKNALKYFLDLDAGEAETIILATELQADLILLDEKLGRFYAKHAGLKIAGTLGVLLKAKKKGIIKNVKPIIEELIEKGFWLSPDLIIHVLQIANE